MVLSALSIGEKFSLGGITTLLGLGMTFVVLALLIGSIYLINIIIKQLSAFLYKKKQQKLSKNPVEELSTVSEHVAEVGISAEKKLAIEAAVRTYLRETDAGKPHENIKIKSVTKL